MDVLISIGVLLVLAPLLVFALANMKRSGRRGGGGAFIALDQVFDPSKRHVLEVQGERVLERDTDEPPPPSPDEDHRKL